MNVVTACLSVV